MPAQGIHPSWLARPLAESGFAPDDASALRVEAVEDWRWGSVEAAFLARVVHELGREIGERALVGVPAELKKLLALATIPPTLDSGAKPASSWITGVGLRVRQDLRALCTFIAMLGEVVRLLPRFAMARAKVRGADVLEMLAGVEQPCARDRRRCQPFDRGHPCLCRRGAVEALRRRCIVDVADLVGIASVRKLTPIATAIVLAGGCTGASFAARIATMQGNEEIDALTTLGVSPIEFLVLPRVIALTLLMPLLYVYGCAFAILEECGSQRRYSTFRRPRTSSSYGRPSAVRTSRSADSRRLCSVRLSRCWDVTTDFRPTAARRASGRRHNERSRGFHCRRHNARCCFRRVRERA